MSVQKYCLFFLLLLSAVGFSQNSTYQGEEDKIHDLVHTKLNVDFNFDNKTMNGEAWITLKPHFYPTNQLILDAKAMRINKITLAKTPLNFSYDNSKLTITLPKIYQKDEEFTVYLKYIAQPEKVTQQGSAAITNAKGLYFINADGTDNNKPTQIWTQGETEASSCWFPTIDAPNQKTTQEINITVPNQFVTLSNGQLIHQTQKGNNRTDHWKLDQPHAPYLFFMGVGAYEIIKDSYKNIPIHYYVEKEYAPYAKQIFGLTPEMMGFFETKLGVAYPWNKYHQIVGRDYVSGAMENTTAVIHGERAYQSIGQLLDENVQENTIAHELFHHWFGNLATSESWSNLTLNESFANYGEYLWREFKYGKENADAHKFEDIEQYKNGQNFDKHLVRFDYNDKEDMFDLVSYNKGGAILHMLRNYLGDEAFFTGLKQYLTNYKYKAAEVHQLRLTFEEVTGKDLNWFFNQWYFSAGHPIIQISYDYNILRNYVTMNVTQVQANEFKFPLTVDVFEGGKKTRHRVFVNGKDASFKFNFSGKDPDLIMVNADGALLADISENKILSDYIFQLKNAENYQHRREALLEVANKQDDKVAFEAVASAINDDFYKIRILALQQVNLINKYLKQDVIDQIVQIALYDKKTLVRAAAIETLGKLIDPKYTYVFKKALESESNAMLGSALVALYYVNKEAAIKKSKQIPDAARKLLATPLTRIFIEEKDESEFPFIAKNVLSGMYLTGNEQTKAIYQKAFNMIAESNNSLAIQNLVDDLVAKSIQYKGFDFDKTAITIMRKMITLQENKKASNMNKNLEIIKTGMAKIIE